MFICGDRAICSFSCLQVGNENFQYALQQLPDLVVLWSTSTDLAATNTTLPGYQRGVPTNLLFDTATTVGLFAAKAALLPSAVV